MRSIIFHCLIGSLLFLETGHGGELRPEPRSCDLLVYGGTPAGIAAAIAAAREGDDVVLVEETMHLGGLVTSGLSHTDFHSFPGLTGIFREMTQRNLQYYSNRYGLDSQQVRDSFQGTHAEPHVYELTLEKMINEHPEIQLFKGCILSSVRVTGETPSLKTVRFISKDRTRFRAFDAKVYVDATYEGDLMAAAGVSYRVGREGSEEYGESLAPEEEDDEVQGYNFRFTMTRDPSLRVSVSKPYGYQREDFVGVLPLLENNRIKQVFGYSTDSIYKAQVPGLPNGKIDINDVSHSLVRLSMPGIHDAWPDGDAETRARLFQQHLDYNVGLLYFLQNDPAVPENFQEEAREWGWCRDEFTDNNYLPWRLYVREARRMVGMHIFTENDMQHSEADARSIFQPNSIAMGDYGPNCHGTSHEGPLFGGRHTGEFYKRVPPYQIPYGVLVPLADEMNNLLVPVACSASHVGFCALRWEPIWASLGQAAGVAAHLAIKTNGEVQAVRVQDLQRILHHQCAATIYVADVFPGSPLFDAVQWIGARGGLHGLEPAPKEPGPRGQHIVGQYYHPNPGHEFKPEKKIDPQLLKRWINLLPDAAATKRERQALFETLKESTRGEIAMKLYGRTSGKHAKSLSVLCTTPR